MTLYDDLGVSADATPEQIAKAHRDGVKKHHPDKPSGDREKFDLVQRAAVVLRDPDRRARYDQTGDADDGPDNALGELTSILMRAFDQAMGKIDWRYGDVAAQMRGELKGFVARIQHAQREAEATQKMIDEACDRLGFSGEGVDPISRVMSQRREGNRHQLAAMARELASTETAIDFAAGYSWRIDQKSPQSLDPWLTLSPGMKDALGGSMRNEV